MKTSPVTPGDLRGPFAVPRWSARVDASGRAVLDARASQMGIVRAARAGVTRLLCDPRRVARADAALALDDLCRFLAQLPRELWAVPVVPAPEPRHAELLARTFFPCVAVEVDGASEPTTAWRELRGFAQAAKKRLMVCLSGLARGGPAGLGALVRDGICVAVLCATADPGPLDGVGPAFRVGELAPDAAAVALGAGTVVGVAGAWIAAAPRTARALHAAAVAGEAERAARLAARLLRSPCARAPRTGPGAAA